MSARLSEIDKVSDLLDRLRLDGAARARGAVIVEGPIDAAIITELLGSDGVSTFPVAGRTNVLKAADRLAADYLRGTVCVADADFDDEVTNRTDQWFLVFTDGADVEAMVLSSAALDRVVETWGSSPKLSALGGTTGLRNMIAETIRPLSILRRQNARMGVGLAFDAIDLHDVVSLSDLSLSVTKLVGRLARASSIDAAEVKTLLTGDAPYCPYTGQMMMRGRDYLVIVDVALRKVAGSCSYQQVKHGVAHRSLLLAVRASDLHDAPFLHRLREAVRRAVVEAEAA